MFEKLVDFVKILFPDEEDDTAAEIVREEIGDYPRGGLYKNMLELLPLWREQQDEEE